MPTPEPITAKTAENMEHIRYLARIIQNDRHAYDQIETLLTEAADRIITSPVQMRELAGERGIDGFVINAILLHFIQKPDFPINTPEDFGILHQMIYWKSDWRDVEEALVPRGKTLCTDAQQTALVAAKILDSGRRHGFLSRVITEEGGVMNGPECFIGLWKLVDKNNVSEEATLLMSQLRKLAQQHFSPNPDQVAQMAKAESDPHLNHQIIRFFCINSSCVITETDQLNTILSAVKKGRGDEKFKRWICDVPAEGLFTIPARTTTWNLRTLASRDSDVWPVSVAIGWEEEIARLALSRKDINTLLNAQEFAKGFFTLRGRIIFIDGYIQKHSKRIPIEQLVAVWKWVDRRSPEELAQTELEGRLFPPDLKSTIEAALLGKLASRIVLTVGERRSLAGIVRQDESGSAMDVLRAEVLKREVRECANMQEAVDHFHWFHLTIRFHFLIQYVSSIQNCSEEDLLLCKDQIWVDAWSFGGGQLMSLVMLRATELKLDVNQAKWAPRTEPEVKPVRVPLRIDPE